MGFLAALGGIAAGVLVAFLLGVILDYLQVRNVLSETVTAWMMLPYTSALAGLVASVVSVSLFARYLRNNRPASKTTTRPSAAPKGMEHVPGMPTFDVNALRSGSADAPPATGSRPAPPISTPPEQKQ